MTFYSETEHLRNLNIRSALVAGIRINGEIYGFVSMDFIRERRIFSDSDIQMVYSIAKLFQLARERFLNKAVQPDTAENREREKSDGSFLFPPAEIETERNRIFLEK